MTIREALPVGDVAEGQWVFRLTGRQRYRVERRTSTASWYDGGLKAKPGMTFLTRSGHLNEKPDTFPVAIEPDDVQGVRGQPFLPHIIFLQGRWRVFYEAPPFNPSFNAIAKAVAFARKRNDLTNT